VEGSIALACRLSAVAALATVALAGCGGGERQDANEPSGTFRVAVVRASFPTKQHLAQPERFVIAVRNTGRETVPNVAVTVNSFAERSEQAGLADPERAVWIVDSSPSGGQTAYTSSRATGPPPALSRSTCPRSRPRRTSTPRRARSSATASSGRSAARALQSGRRARRLEGQSA
jgi:hypothetical protein